MLVYFHGGCQDGWVAAFVAKLKYPEAELHGLNYGVAGQFERVLAEAAGDNVMMVDFSFKKTEENEAVRRVAKSFIVLDHHASQAPVLAGCEYAIFDNDRSGAGLTWDYLFGKDSDLRKEDSGQEYILPYKKEFVHDVSVFAIERPWWVNYTEDQDLWRFRLPHSKEVNAYLRAQEYSVERWQELMTQPTEVDAWHLGIAIRQYVDKLNQEIVAETMEGIWLFEGRNYRTAVVNTKIISEPGALLTNDGYDIAIGWFERHDDLIQFGLRSKQPGNVDVGAICKNFHGGGGHKHAGGFEMNIREGRELIDSILGR